METEEGLKMFQFIKDLCWGKRTPFGLEIAKLLTNDPENFTLQNGCWLRHPSINMTIYVPIAWSGVKVDYPGNGKNLLSYQDKYYIHKLVVQNMYRMKIE